MTKTSKRISVLMPLYNCEPVVERAVQSILDQSFADFEIIAVDDGSTDRTGSIIDLMAARDDRLVVVHTANNGIVAALNTSLSRATGDYVARMDGDDIARVDRFAVQVAHLDANPKCVCVGSLYRLIDRDGVVISAINPFKSQRQTDLSRFPPHVTSLSHPSIMCRRAQLSLIGGYRSNFPHAEDYDLFLRLSRLGILDTIQEYLLDYRVYVESVSDRNFEKQIESSLNATLSAISILRGRVDPAFTLGKLSRSDYYMVIGDPGFETLFELYAEVRMMEACNARQRYSESTAIFVATLRKVPGLLPQFWSDIRYWRLFLRVLKDGARSLLRRA